MSGKITGEEIKTYSRKVNEAHHPQKLCAFTEAGSVSVLSSPSISYCPSDQTPASMALFLCHHRAIHWPYLSRRLLHRSHGCSCALPSPGKGTSTRGIPFLCSSMCPARWALILPQSEQTPWHWGQLHSPAACTPRGHRPSPSHHHRWCPRSPGQGSPLSRRRDLLRPPGGAVCCLRREKWDNGAFTRGIKVFCPVGPSPEQ